MSSHASLRSISLFLVIDLFSFLQWLRMIFSRQMQIECDVVLVVKNVFNPGRWYIENNKLILSVLEIIICVKIFAHLGHPSMIDHIKANSYCVLKSFN